MNTLQTAAVTGQKVEDRVSKWAARQSDGLGKDPSSAPLSMSHPEKSA